MSEVSQAVARSHPVVAADELSSVRGDIFVALLCHVSRSSNIKTLLTDLLSLGCKHISIYGDASATVEDEIDAILEETEQGLAVVTASHEGETPEDVVNFVFAVLPPKARAIAVFEDRAKSEHILAEFERLGA